MIQGPKPYRYSRCARAKSIVAFSLDYSLEAFSCYPTHVSVAALSVQTTALTNYVNQRFLSY